jgi:hypothetical protein
MSEELQLRFDYAALDVETRAFVEERTERIHNLARMTASAIVQIGQYLSEVKERLKHGQFLEWIEKEFAWHRDTANNFMQVYECFKCRDFRQMEIDVSALYLIAKPSMPEPVRAEMMRRAENGEVVTHQGARALVQQFAETGELPDVDVSLPKMIASVSGRMQAKQTIKKMTAAEVAEEEKLRERMRVNSERMHVVMSVIRAIECLAGTNLTVPQIAKEIRRLDSPDKDWHGQVRQARQMLAALGTELKP